MGFCEELCKHFQREAANRILTRWKQDPTTTRRAYGEHQWLTDDPKNDKPLSEEEVAHYIITLKRHGRRYLYELFPEEDAKRIRRQEEHIRWAEEHWPLLAAYAWQQYECGPGHVYVVPRNLPLLLPTPDLVVGGRQLYYREDEQLKEPPEKSVHIIFVCDYPEARWLFEERLSLALEPPPPVAYRQCPLPAVEEAIDGPVEPDAPPGSSCPETYFLEGLNAQAIIAKWKETPWLPRRDFRLGGTEDDPEGCQPLDDLNIWGYSRTARVWRWSMFRRNQTARNIVVPPRQAKRRRWAKRHWQALAAFAWERFLTDGPGWVVAKRLRKRRRRPWLLDGCQMHYVKGSPDYDPRKSVCLTFNSKGPDETCSPWDEWRLAMEPPPPVAYRLRERKKRGRA